MVGKPQRNKATLICTAYPENQPKKPHTGPPFGEAAALWRRSSSSTLLLPGPSTLHSILAACFIPFPNSACRAHTANQ